MLKHFALNWSWNTRLNLLLLAALFLFFVGFTTALFPPLFGTLQEI
ncbi:MAG: hypothetical protein O7J95_19290 [Planctomycetota bacterium]|nr:hypothetical protein [Planctomycetota bacterium]